MSQDDINGDRRIKYDPQCHVTKQLTPHEFETEVSMTVKPVVCISQLAMDKMHTYLMLSTKEISWLGTVRQLKPGKFLIDDVFLLHQEVDERATIISPESQALFMQEILKQPNGPKIWESIAFWGHLHPNNSTDPSPRDNHQMNTFKQAEIPFFIRGIAALNGRMEFTVYLYRKGWGNIVVHDVPWYLYHPIPRNIEQNVKEEFANKVTVILPPPPSTQKTGVLVASKRKARKKKTPTTVFSQAALLANFDDPDTNNGGY